MKPKIDVKKIRQNGTGQAPAGEQEKMDMETIGALLDENKAQAKQIEQLERERKGLGTILFLAERKKFRAKIAQLEAENRWIPVSERLPEMYDCPHPHSEEVLILGVEGMEKLIGWFEKDRGWRYGDGTIEVFPTLWKPIILPNQALQGKGE